MNSFKTINGSVEAEIVLNRQMALERVQSGIPQAYPDTQLHCYRVIAPGSQDDFTAILTSHLSTSEKVRVL
jgi:hypothetical protein